VALTDEADLPAHEDPLLRNRRSNQPVNEHRARNAKKAKHRANKILLPTPNKKRNHQSVIAGLVQRHLLESIGTFQVVVHTVQKKSGNVIESGAKGETLIAIVTPAQGENTTVIEETEIGTKVAIGTGTVTETRIEMNLDETETVTEIVTVNVAAIATKIVTETDVVTEIVTEAENGIVRGTETANEVPGVGMIVEMTEGTPEQMVGAMTREMIVGMTDGMTGEMINGTTAGMIEEMTEGMTEETRDEMTGETEVYTATGIGALPVETETMSKLIVMCLDASHVQSYILNLSLAIDGDQDVLVKTKNRFLIQRHLHPQPCQNLLEASCPNVYGN